MAELRTKTRRTTREAAESPRSFDITAVIGTIELSKYGKGSPLMAAFEAIAKHDAPGTYVFTIPGEDNSGYKFTVTGEFIPGDTQREQERREERDRTSLAESKEERFERVRQQQ